MVGVWCDFCVGVYWFVCVEDGVECVCVVVRYFDCDDLG